MKNQLAQIEELVQATERALTALTESTSESLPSATKNLQEALAKAQKEISLDINEIEASPERDEIKKALKNLHDLTQICLERTRMEKGMVVQSFQKMNSSRRFMNASKNTANPSHSTLNQQA